jgi:hypothetical protein
MRAPGWAALVLVTSVAPTKNLQQCSTLSVRRSVSSTERHPAPQPRSGELDIDQT